MPFMGLSAIQYDTLKRFFHFKPFQLIFILVLAA